MATPQRPVRRLRPNVGKEGETLFIPSKSFVAVAIPGRVKSTATALRLLGGKHAVESYLASLRTVPPPPASSTSSSSSVSSTAAAPGTSDPSTSSPVPTSTDGSSSSAAAAAVAPASVSAPSLSSSASSGLVPAAPSEEKLFLRFSPQDPIYFKCIASTPSPAAGLLLRIRRRRRSGSSIEILGRVVRHHSFEGLADFYYAPPSHARAPFDFRSLLLDKEEEHEKQQEDQRHGTALHRYPPFGGSSLSSYSDSAKSSLHTRDTAAAAASHTAAATRDLSFSSPASLGYMASPAAAAACSFPSHSTFSSSSSSSCRHQVLPFIPPPIFCRFSQPAKHNLFDVLVEDDLSATAGPAAPSRGDAAAVAVAPASSVGAPPPTLATSAAGSSHGAAAGSRAAVIAAVPAAAAPSSPRVVATTFRAASHVSSATPTLLNPATAWANEVAITAPSTSTTTAIVDKSEGSAILQQTPSVRENDYTSTLAYDSQYATIAPLSAGSSAPAVPTIANANTTAVTTDITDSSTAAAAVRPAAAAAPGLMAVPGRGVAASKSSRDVAAAAEYSGSGVSTAAAAAGVVRVSSVLQQELLQQREDMQQQQQQEGVAEKCQPTVEEAAAGGGETEIIVDSQQQQQGRVEEDEERGEDMTAVAGAAETEILWLGSKKSGEEFNAVCRYEDVSVPVRPPAAAVRAAADEVLLMLLQQLLQQQPVWLRSSLDLLLPPDFSAWRRKPAYAKTCFLFADGPWRGCLCRFGYDPRGCAASRFYQTIDFRDSFFRTTNWRRIKEKEDISSAAAAAASAAAAAALASSSSSSFASCAKSQKQQQQSEEDAFCRDEAATACLLQQHQQSSSSNTALLEQRFLLPPSRPSVLYQLKEIQDDAVQKLLRDAPVLPAACRETGWFPAATMKTLRELLAIKSERMRRAHNA